MNKPNWKAWGFAASFAMASAGAWANGMMYDSPLLTTSSVWSPFRRFQLQDENLAVKLGATPTMPQ